MSQGKQQNAYAERLTQVSKNLPAVALVATADNTGWITGEILHAHQNGHQALVTSKVDTDLDALEYARMLGAQVIEPPRGLMRAVEPEERLRKFAQEEGYPGLLYHSHGTERIDLQRSCEALNDLEQFAIDAYPQPAVDQEPSVLVGIPAYNEADTIASVVESASEYADTVLVVDDGSNDDTAEVAGGAGATVLEHQTNSGYGAALKSVFKQASRAEADRLVILDADGQHDASDIPKLVGRQRETGADVVIGCRFGAETETEMPMYRRIGLAIINFLTNLSLGVFQPQAGVSDTQSGFRAYSKTAIETLAADNSLGDEMDASLNILYHAYSNDYEIEEVPTTIDYDVEDKNTQSPIQHGMTLVSNILRRVERERPITMIGVPGLLCTFGGFGFGYQTLLNYVQYGVVPIGLALTATSFLMIGMLATFAAIVLHSLKLHRG